MNDYVKFKNDAEAVGAERNDARGGNEHCGYDEALRGHLGCRLVLPVFVAHQQRVDDDVTRHEALDGSRKQNGQAEQ